jgi:hypothetical protein
MIGVWGLFFFIVGYARDRNDLASTVINHPTLFFESQLLSNPPITSPSKPRTKTHLVGPLCSEVWQNRNRTSFSDFVKAYLPDMIAPALMLLREAVDCKFKLDSQVVKYCT